MMQRAIRFAGSVLIAALGYNLCEVAGANAQQDVTLGDRRIVGGEPADIKDFPWQVALNIRRPSGPFLCGGSIVAAKWILTAAHCFDQATRPAEVRAKGGATDYAALGNWVEVERVVLHEHFNPQTYENDVAMLKLRSPPNGKIIPMAGANMRLALGDPLEVTGWGATAESGEVTPRLLRATVPYVDSAICNAPASYNGAVGPGMLCAGRKHGGTDACQGDSGGPLVADTAEGPVLVGVVSFGEGCARRLKYGVYTRVSVYRDWAKAVISAAP